MNKISFKTLKVFGLSLVLLALYFFLEHSNKVSLILVAIQKSSSSRGFGIYIALNLLKWFLLMFACISVFQIFLRFFKKKQN
jgi:hypothetical protein